MSITVAKDIGGQSLILETGTMARQAHGAVVARYGDTMVLATVVMAKSPAPGLDFLPLTVEYRERSAAAGRFPGGFFKREGRPTEKEILTSRIVDRSIRPLFSKAHRNEIQLFCTVISADEHNDPDVISMIAAFAALAISPLPFQEILASVRVGRIDGEFRVNPNYEDMQKSTMNLIVAGKMDSLVMVEATIQEEPEEVVLEALEFAHQQIQSIVGLIQELVEKAGVPKLPTPEKVVDEALQQALHGAYRERILNAISVADKTEREDLMDAITNEALEQHAPDETDKESRNVVKGILHDLERDLVRDRIVNQSVRSDGRGLTDIRPISIQIGMVPRTHGSALFTRGQTQSLASLTLGTVSDQQQVDTLLGESFKRFMLHYNFPPFSVGEVRPIRGPGRREIGHGALAEKALNPVLPKEDDFPYTIRIISDVLESNGSSSMASVCSGSLAMMDAGVPIRTSVAGIAMGMIKEKDKIAILSDILGQEDHLGDMDFKVAGSRKGITALQMDLKLDGIDRSLMAQALQQAREGRYHILDLMDQAIVEPRANLSKYAPRLVTLFVEKSKIGEIIGPGGKTIRGIIEETGVKIDIDDDGKIIISSTDEAASQRAIEMVNYLTEEVEVGRIYKGKVTRILNFGAFVEILPGKEGLVHISHLDAQRIERVEDVVKEGDVIQVKVIEIDHLGRVNLSKKEADWEISGEGPPPSYERNSGGGGDDRPRNGGGGGRPQRGGRDRNSDRRGPRRG